MKRSARAVLGCLAAAAALSTPAFASAGLGVGAHYTRSETHGTDDGTNLIGGMARLRTPLLGLEAGVDYRRDEDVAPGVSLTTWPVTASVLFYPLPMIHANAGIGWYHTTLDLSPTLVGPRDDTVTDVGYHAGAGVELPVARSLALTGDVRWVTIDRDFDDLNDVEGLSEVKSDFVTFQVGALVYFSPFGN